DRDLCIGSSRGKRRDKDDQSDPTHNCASKNPAEYLISRCKEDDGEGRGRRPRVGQGRGTRRLDSPPPAMWPLTAMLVGPCFTFIPPALPSCAERVPIGGEWIHEIKHDGYRMVVRLGLGGKAMRSIIAALTLVQIMMLGTTKIGTAMTGE